MKNITLRAVIAIVGIMMLTACTDAVKNYDVIIIGGGTSGTAAGVQAARLGARTLIVEQSEWLGGMLTSAGVSATDGCYRLRGGLWGEFRDSLEAHYGGAEALKTGWVSNVMFEPSVGNRIFQNIAKAEKKLTVWFNAKAVDFTQTQDDQWRVSVVRDGHTTELRCRVLIDATELGDVASKVGVGYDVGMDSKQTTGESIAPEKAHAIVQDLTFAAILKDYGHDVTIARPEGYDSTEFACCCTSDICRTPKEADRMWSREKLITYGELPNGKYMINWPIEGNDYYVDMVEMSPDQRAEAITKAKAHTMRFIYFLQTQLGFNNLGLADDEYPTEDRLPIIPYHRESRRIHGVVQFTLNHITKPYEQSQPLYRTAIAVGDYPVDQHHARYSGWDELPNLYFYSIPSYGVPLGVMIPRDVKHLIVAEKSISVTNIVNGSTRLQPVVLQLGQAAGVVAAMAAKERVDVAEVRVRDVQQTLLDAGCYLLPYLDVTPDDPSFKALQRIGATGIIKGHGANVGWENQSWIDADKTIDVATLTAGLAEFYDVTTLPEQHENVTATALGDMIAQAQGESRDTVTANMERCWKEQLQSPFDTTRPLTRGECAVIIDAMLDPFDTINVDMEGNTNKQ